MINSRKPIAPEEVAKHYDELDAFYRDIWGEHVHHGLWIRGDESRDVAVANLVELIAKEARIGQGTSICDIGCGYGATARMMTEWWGAVATGVTISPAQYEYAKVHPGNTGNGPQYILADWLTCELESGIFDAVFACESSEHMPDKVGFFARAAHVLKPGGRLVVCAWLAAEKLTPFQEKWLLEPICREGRMPNIGTESDYRRFAAIEGFTCEKVQDISRHVASTWPRIAFTFFGKLVRDPRYIRFLSDRHARNRVFAMTVLRLWIAFKTGAMRYGVFTFVKASP